MERFVIGSGSIQIGYGSAEIHIRDPSWHRRVLPEIRASTADASAGNMQKLTALCC